MVGCSCLMKPLKILVLLMISGAYCGKSSNRPAHALIPFSPLIPSSHSTTIPDLVIGKYPSALLKYFSRNSPDNAPVNGPNRAGRMVSPDSTLTTIGRCSGELGGQTASMQSCPPARRSSPVSPLRQITPQSHKTHTDPTDINHPTNYLERELSTTPTVIGKGAGEPGSVVATFYVETDILDVRDPVNKSILSPDLRTLKASEKERSSPDSSTRALSTDTTQATPGSGSNTHTPICIITSTTATRRRRIRLSVDRWPLLMDGARDNTIKPFNKWKPGQTIDSAGPTAGYRREKFNNIDDREIALKAAAIPFGSKRVGAASLPLMAALDIGGANATTPIQLFSVVSTANLRDNAKTINHEQITTDANEFLLTPRNNIPVQLDHQFFITDSTVCGHRAFETWLFCRVAPRRTN